MIERIDAIIIGAGHNGLVCASYLARAGMKVVCLESGDAAGGMSAPRIIGENYHFPGIATATYPVNAAIRRDLKLDQFPLGMAVADMNSDGNDDIVVLYPEQARIFLSGGSPAGPYTPAATVDIPGAIGPLACGDFIADGRPDMVVVLDDGKLQIIEATKPQETVTP